MAEDTRRQTGRPSPVCPPQDHRERVASVVSTFGKSIAPLLRQNRGQSEANLTGPVEETLKTIGKILGLKILIHREAADMSLGVRPDLAVDCDGAHIGVVELKAPGKGVPGTPSWGSKRDRLQWTKLQKLPNVLYTDGSQWALYRYGERMGQVGKLEGDLKHAGSTLKEVDSAFYGAVSSFLWWQPTPPRDPRSLIRISAGLCGLLRDEVKTELSAERAGFSDPLFTDHMADWQEWLFPELTSAEFVDAYAQTITFGLLLARHQGIAFEGLEIAAIGELLAERHHLVGRALSILTARPDQGKSLEERSIVLQTMRRVIGVADWSHWKNSGTYHWMYEEFLSRYDPAVRRQTGAYFTPTPVANHMVRLVDTVLKGHLSVAAGLRDRDVVILDPAMGTGSFLQSVLDNVAETAKIDGADVPATIRNIVGRLVGFERQLGPFAVAELKVSQAMATYGVRGRGRRRLFVTDTLDDPTKAIIPSGRVYAPLADSRRNSNAVKLNEPVTVVLGNPPYKARGKADGKWIVDKGSRGRSLLDDFKSIGTGRLDSKLHDLAVYFWRWGIWKAFESTPEQPAGVVAFITTKAYLTGDAFSGMRAFLRKTADFGWIIDLSEEDHRSSKATRIFAEVQNPVCIGIFARGREPQLTSPAHVRYVSLRGTRLDKFQRLQTIDIDGDVWQTCSDAWGSPFLPPDPERWRELPHISAIMPFSSLGVTPNRAWVRAPEPETLVQRWVQLIKAEDDTKSRLMKETRDRTIDTIRSVDVDGPAGPSLRSETSLMPRISKIGFRSFDNQYLIADLRVVDYIRPSLWRRHGPRQLYLVTQLGQRITTGPAAVFSACIPDTHFFNGRGGRVFPLFLDAAGEESNFPNRILSLLSEALESEVTALHLLRYLACILSHSGYTETFRDELRRPGIHVPLTKDRAIWREAIEIGSRVIAAHTYDEYAGNSTYDMQQISSLRPNVVVPIDASQRPDRMRYDAPRRTLLVGSGTLFPVSPEVWTYSISGMNVIKHWFNYRKQRPTGRKGGSPLDDTRVDGWDLVDTETMRDLIARVQYCIDLEGMQSEILTRVLASNCFDSSEVQPIHGESDTRLDTGKAGQLF